MTSASQRWDWGNSAFPILSMGITKHISSSQYETSSKNAQGEKVNDHSFYFMMITVIIFIVHVMCLILIFKDLR